MVKNEINRVNVHALYATKIGQIGEVGFLPEKYLTTK